MVLLLPTNADDDDIVKASDNCGKHVVMMHPNSDSNNNDIITLLCRLEYRIFISRCLPPKDAREMNTNKTTLDVFECE